MKRFLILLSLLFCNTVYADTINLHWLNEDGSVYENSTCTVDGDLNIPSTPPTKYGYTFTGWKMSNYIPIEYLESTGTQYIDTGFVPNSNTKVQISFSGSDYTSNYAIFGARVLGAGQLASGRYEYTLFISTQVNPLHPRVDYSGSGATSAIFVAELVPNTITTIMKDKEKNYINDVQFDSNQSDSFSCSYSAYLFALNEGNTLKFPAPVKIYWAKIYDNDVLVRDFIPVLDKNGTPCMYDKVTRQFFYNAGTGQFIAGPVLTE